MSKAVVTGGLGFIGSHIVDQLVERDFEVKVVDNLSSGKREYANPKAEIIEADILDTDKSVFMDCDYVFHAAALPRIQPSFDDPVEHERANVVATIDLIEKLKGNNKLKKLVFSSSSAVYGNTSELPTTENADIAPLSPYALQKYTAEQYCLLLGERFGIPVVALRYFNVYGPRSFNPDNPQNAYSSVVGIFAEQKKAGESLTITGDGLQERDFVHVKDVARANLIAATSDRNLEVFNIGFGSAISIKDLALLFDSPIEYIPERKGEAQITLADISKAKSGLKWSPKVSLKEGIKELSPTLVCAG